MPVNMDKLVSLDRAKEIKTTENGMIATVEASSTASKAYAVGDYFYYTGKLYKATAAIASGGTITVGTNCTLAKLADDVGDLKSAIDAGEKNSFTVSSGIGRWIEKRTIDSSGTVKIDNSVMYNEEYLEISKYQIDGGIHFEDLTENNGFFVTAAFYRANKQFISRPSYSRGSKELIVSIPNDAAYFRVVIVYKINDESVPGTVADMPLDALYLMSLTYKESLDFTIDKMEKELDLVNLVPLTNNIPPIITSNMSNPGQGLCKVGNYFVISRMGSDSYDSAGSTVHIDVYDSSFSNIGYMLHDLGHGSGLCYNETYNAFLMTNGNANVAPRLDIMLNASENVESAVDGSHPSYLFGGDNVLSIFLTKNGTDLMENADGVGWCIAGNDRLVLIALRDKSTYKKVFYQGLLGVGSTDFSLSENGYGTFVSGKTDTELNGTILITDRFDYVSEPITSTQGMFFNNGDLIISSSKTECLFYKVKFYDKGYKIVDKYKATFYQSDGSEYQCEPEGIVKIDDSNYYCATTRGILKFSI